MRYPVGFRPTWRDALEAACESAQKTLMRYWVFRAYDPQADNEVWHFRPVELPDETLHLGIRV